MVGREEKQKREVGTARVTWLQLLSAFFGAICVVFGFLWQDEAARTREVDGNYCIKHYDELQNKYFKEIDSRRNLQRQNFRLKAQHLVDSINLLNCSK